MLVIELSQTEIKFLLWMRYQVSDYIAAILRFRGLKVCGVLYQSWDAMLSLFSNERDHLPQ